MNVITLGEPLVEFYRRETGEPFDEVGDFVGPFPAGAPAIFADTAAKLGCLCGFFGTVGDDNFGELITKKLMSDNVDTSGIRTLSDYTTGTSFVTYSEDGRRKFIFHLRHAAAGQLSPDDVDPTRVSEADFLHVMGSTLLISESCRKACYKAVEIAEENDVKISFDPNVRTELLDPKSTRKICRPILENCDLILPNTEEAKLFTGKVDSEKSAERLLDIGIRIVVIKMGRKGSMIVTEEERIDAPAFLVKEIDPTGAGDSFDAGFVYNLLEGRNLKEAARFANAVGAISVTGRGGMGKIPTEEEVRGFIEKARIRK